MSRDGSLERVIPRSVRSGPGVELRFIPEEDLAILGSGTFDNRGVHLLFPLCDRFRSSLVGGIERVQGGQAKARQQCPDRGKTQGDPEMFLHQVFDDLASPQPGVKAKLDRALAIDPTKDLRFLRRGQFFRSTSPIFGIQGL